MTIENNLMSQLQEEFHAEEYDYEVGSPHLRHRRLHNEMVGRVRDLVAEQFARAGRCRVLEVGAGHGSFTDPIAAMGADVTVTEMSRPSLRRLERRFLSNPKVRLIYDADGQTAIQDPATYDLILCISVLHHIPDCYEFTRQLVAKIEPGGAFASFQDPLWYPRRSRLNLAVDKGSYYAWRVCRGNWRQGISTRIRRMKGVYDTNKPADMVEYHVVRAGVDEERLKSILSENFMHVEHWKYWSTQSPLLQSVGEKLRVHSTFGLTARVRSLSDVHTVPEPAWSPGSSC